ncbi:hypothetical protein K503DRAFT_772842 [Rhizopogon vinicolor AM-OR11-026]|uniref:Uncharacterized protein n=1 Tax=Rhizopogon vinicolor AM-OR11-026 TaxID=1314800 RepID=A0A1B7MU62_9AGAM|nr:hypothetical protein K503DRAFT_772842 [Rhizopogon vinicolor AM-OR11-026]
MKSKGTSEHDDGLLDYLEDIIGTAAPKAPIKTALSEVDLLAGERGKAKLEAERKKDMTEARERAFLYIFLRKR